MAVHIIAKVRLKEDGKTYVIVTKTLTDDATGRVLQVLGLTRNGQWAVKDELDASGPTPRVAYLIGPYTETYEAVNGCLRSKRRSGSG